MTQVGKAWEWWISAAGLRLGTRNLVRVMHDGARLLGSYSEAERSLRERQPIHSGWLSPRLRTPRGGSKTTRRERSTHTALGRGGDSERRVNRKRGARQVAIWSRKLEKSFRL